MPASKSFFIDFTILSLNRPAICFQRVEILDFQFCILYVVLQWIFSNFVVCCSHVAVLTYCRYNTRLNNS